MKNRIKSLVNTVEAWQLGQNSPMEKNLTEQGKIVCVAPGKYEVFSQEARGAHGEAAVSGDYFKVDKSGNPYPNDRGWFEKNHRWISGDMYAQIQRPVLAWMLGDPMDPVIEFLQEHKGLKISESGFCAPLWGTELSANSDAAIVIYHTEYDAEKICDVDFNFVARDEFERCYAEVPENE